MAAALIKYRNDSGVRDALVLSIERYGAVRCGTVRYGVVRYNDASINSIEILCSQKFISELNSPINHYFFREKAKFKYAILCAPNFKVFYYYFIPIMD